MSNTYKMEQKSTSFPDPYPLIGHTYHFISDLDGFYGRCRAADSDILRVELGPKTFYYITSPEIIERILVNDTNIFKKGNFMKNMMKDVWGDSILLREGERWKRQRARLQSLFEMNTVQSYTDTIVRLTESQIEQWQQGHQYRIDRKMEELSLKILFKILFNTHVGSEAKEIVATAKDVDAKFNLSSVSAVLPTWIPTRTNQKYKQAIQKLKAQIEALLQDRNCNDQPNIVTVLRDAVTDETTNVTEDTVRDELLAFLLEYDTIGLNVAYTLHLLANNTSKKNRLQEELNTKLGDRPLTAENLSELSYMKKVIKESLRLFPSVHTIYRQPTQSVELRGQQIDSDSILALSPFIVHRDERFYEKPEQFTPERWTEEFEDQLPGLAYFPFGGGPRHCIGMRLAQLSTQLVIAIILQKYDVRPTDDGTISPVFSLGLQPRDGISLEIA